MFRRDARPVRLRDERIARLYNNKFIINIIP